MGPAIARRTTPEKRLNMSNIPHRLNRLEDATHQIAKPEDAQEREERLRHIREAAEHANYCGWERDGEQLFEIDVDGDVFCTYDGKPVTDGRQILAEHFYFMELGWGGPGLIHDEEAQAFYSLSGELAVSRDRVDLQHLLGPISGRRSGE